MVIPFTLVLSLFTAVLISQVQNGIMAGIFRVIAYLPVILPISIAMLVWAKLFDYHFGYLNVLLQDFGVANPPNWLGSPKTALYAMVIPTVWSRFGSWTLLFLIGIYNINREIYEAARVDGANGWRQFLHITLPLLKPVFTSGAGAGYGRRQRDRRVDDSLWRHHRRSGPIRLTTGVYLYRIAFIHGDMRMGYAATMSLFLGLVNMAVTVFVFRALRTERALNLTINNLMPKHKLLIASDLHFSVNLQQEMAAMEARLPPGEYDHRQDGRLFWHNELLVEQMSSMLDALVELAADEKPDLLIFLGDLVNTNWVENVAALAAKVRAFNCPFEVVTGNHDIYLAEPASRVQEALQADAFPSGLRHHLWEDWGLIFLDLFAHDNEGGWNKWLDLAADPITIDYRPEDIHAALALLDAHPEQRFLVYGHFPMCTPAASIRRPGRKIGLNWRGGAQLTQRLQEPNNPRRYSQRPPTFCPLATLCPRFPLDAARTGRISLCGNDCRTGRCAGDRSPRPTAARIGRPVVAYTQPKLDSGHNRRVASYSYSVDRNGLDVPGNCIVVEHVLALGRCGVLILSRI